MNAPLPRNAALIADISHAIAKLSDWRTTLERSRADSSAAMLDQVAALQAINALWPDWLEGEIAAWVDALASDYGIGPDGYPLDDVPEWSPSMVHPDDPCQRKGFW